jgi:TRAP-type C4-dicarboxylate transport system permease small subunit
MLGRVANNLKKLVFPISQILGDFSLVVMVFVTLLVVVDVCARRLFNSPLGGTHELSGFAFSIIVFLPLAWCAINDGHVELSIVVDRLPKIAKLSIEVIMMFITTVILGLMTSQILVHGTTLQAGKAETAILGIPYYPFLYLASFGGIILTLAFLIRFIRSLSNIIEERRR